MNYDLWENTPNLLDLSVTLPLIPLYYVALEYEPPYYELPYYEPPYYEPPYYEPPYFCGANVWRHSTTATRNLAPQKYGDSYFYMAIDMAPFQKCGAIPEFDFR